MKTRKTRTATALEHYVKIGSQCQSGRRIDSYCRKWEIKPLVVFWWLEIDILVVVWRIDMRKRIIIRIWKQPDSPGNIVFDRGGGYIAIIAIRKFNAATIVFYGVIIDLKELGIGGNQSITVILL